MKKILIFVASFLVVNGCLSAENNQASFSGVQTINTITTIDIPDYNDGKTYKVAVSIDERPLPDDRRGCRRSRTSIPAR